MHGLNDPNHIENERGEALKACMDQFFIIENEVIFMGDPLSKLYEQIKYKEINMQI
jgi:hypothetical protein